MENEEKDENKDENLDTQNKDNPVSDKDNNSDEKQDEEKQFTQSDVDKMIQKRIERENKKSAKAMKDLQAKLDALEHPEQHKDDKPKDNETEAKVAKALEKAKKATLTSTAKIEAAKLGINPKYINAAVKLADFSNVDIDDDELTVDADDIGEALKKVLKDMPIFASEQDNNGFHIGKDGKNKKPAKSGILDNLPKASKPWNRFK